MQCDRKKVLTDMPEMALQWDYDKNGDLDPSLLTCGSNKKVWWKCDEGHSYATTIYHKTSRNSGCPICSGKKIVAGINDLATLNPILASEWNYDRNVSLPSSVALHSNKKIWWKCSICGHEWEAKVNDRANGNSCPICAKKKQTDSFRLNNYLVQGENDLLTLRPDLVLEWNYQKNEDVLPEDRTTHSKEKVWWKCLFCGNEWQATIKNRVDNNSGCPKCSRYRRTSFPEQALFYYIKHQYPDAENGYRFPNERLLELDIFIPSVGVGIEYDGKAWHNYETQSQKLVKKYITCKENNIKLLRVSEIQSNMIAHDNCDSFYYRSDLSDEGLNNVIKEVLDDLGVYIHVNVANDRASIMKGYIQSVQEKSIAYNYPEHIKYWDVEKNNGITANMVNCTSNKKYWWKCELGHSFVMNPASYFGGLKKDYGCPVCSGHQIQIGFNDFKTKFPELAEEWSEKNVPIKITDIHYGSTKKYWWRCPKGHEYLASPNSRTANRTGCPYCAGKLK